MAKQSVSQKTEQSKKLPNISLGVVIGILAVLVIIFYYPLLFGGKFLWEDFLEQEFPFRTFATTSLASGHIPGWNPYTFCGMPFVADIQVAFWYPMNMLQSLFVSGNSLSPVVMQWFIVLHYLVAAVGMYLLVRNIFHTDEWSALFAAVTYAFSGYLTAQPMHQMIIYQLALFPWVVLLFLKGCDSWKYSIAAGLALGVMYLAGHPQTSLFLTFFLALLGIYEIVYRLRHKDGASFSIQMVIRMAVPAVIAFGLFAIQLLPAQELAGLSQRNELSFEKSVEGSLYFGHLFTLVVPRLFGVTDAMHEATVQYWHGPSYLSWETMCYIGVLPLLFAVIAAFVGKKKYVAFFSGMSLFAVCFSLGDHFFIYKLFFHLPLFNKLRTPARMMMIFAFAMSALSGVGLSQAIKKELPDRLRSIIYITGIILTLPWLAATLSIVTPASFLANVPDFAMQSFSWASGQAAFPVLSALLIALLLPRKKFAGFPLAITVLLLTGFELFFYGMGLNASTEDPRTAYREQPQLVEMLKADQAKELSRARIRSAHAILLKRNQGPYDRIQLLEGYNPLVLQRNAPQCVNSEITADLLNIKWSVVENGQQAGFGQRPTYLPRVKMYYKTIVKPDEDAVAILKSDSSFDYRNTILLEENPSIQISAVDSSATATVISFETDHITGKVHTAANGMLFFSEVYYPAWHAYIDGKETKLYRAFTALRAVEVPIGDHTVELRYESSAFRTGSYITLATLIASVLALVIVSRKKSGGETN